MKPRVFLDSDVVISSLLSNRGAAHLLLKSLHITQVISTSSDHEIKAVCHRLKVTINQFTLLKTSLLILRSPSPTKIQTYHSYVRDPNDAHIIASAHHARCRFLVTYNHRHYQVETIKRQLNIQVVSPGQLLQYLRSQKATN